MTLGGVKDPLGRADTPRNPGVKPCVFEVTASFLLDVFEHTESLRSALQEHERRPQHSTDTQPLLACASAVDK